MSRTRSNYGLNVVTRGPLANINSVLFCIQVFRVKDLLFLHQRLLSDNYENKVYVLLKHLDEKLAQLHLKNLGVKLTTLTDAQSEYLGISKEGPFKTDYYRY